MAKILDKNHSNHTKLVKLRQSYDWLSEELVGLYNVKADAELKAVFGFSHAHQDEESYAKIRT